MVDMNLVKLLAARNGSDEWVNLLIPLLLVFGSAIAGVIKRFTKAKQPGRKGQGQPAEEDHPTPNWRQRLEQQLAQMQYQQEAERRPAEVPSGGASSHDTFEASEDARPTKAYRSERERAAKKAVAAPKDVVRTQLKAPEPILEPAGSPSKPQARPAAIPARSGVRIDLSDPDALKRAIVQYEILGKPIGLRDPSSAHVGDRIY
jgi:hypothetical protein